MVVLHTDAVKSHLGHPDRCTERGTISDERLSFVRTWRWDCGCRGEIIAGSLIELARCSRHERAA